MAGSGDTISRIERWDSVRLLTETRKRCPTLKAPLSDDLLRRLLAYEIQLDDFGGLTVAEEKALQTAAISPASSPTSKLVPGTRLLRRWQEMTHEVVVTDSGYLWQGRTYKSLSRIACLITGTNWSGPRFFGLRD